MAVHEASIDFWQIDDDPRNEGELQKDASLYNPEETKLKHLTLLPAQLLFFQQFH